MFTALKRLFDLRKEQGLCRTSVCRPPFKITRPQSHDVTPASTVTRAPHGDGQPTAHLSVPVIYGPRLRGTRATHLSAHSRQRPQLHPFPAFPMLALPVPKMQLTSLPSARRIRVCSARHSGASHRQHVQQPSVRHAGVSCRASSDTDSELMSMDYEVTKDRSLSANWKPMINVAITGAAGQICNHLLFMLAAGEVYGKDQPIALNLLGSERSREALEGVAMELEDSLYPLLQQLSIGIDPEAVFQDADWAIMVGAKPRGPGMERAELLDLNGQVFEVQGKALNKVSSRVSSNEARRGAEGPLPPHCRLQRPPDRAVGHMHKSRTAAVLHYSPAPPACVAVSPLCMCVRHRTHALCLWHGSSRPHSAHVRRRRKPPTRFLYAHAPRSPPCAPARPSVMLCDPAGGQEDVQSDGGGQPV